MTDLLAVERAKLGDGGSERIARLDTHLRRTLTAREYVETANGITTAEAFLAAERKHKLGDGAVGRTAEDRESALRQAYPHSPPSERRRRAPEPHRTDLDLMYPTMKKG